MWLAAQIQSLGISVRHPPPSPAALVERGQQSAIMITIPICVYGRTAFLATATASTGCEVPSFPFCNGRLVFERYYRELLNFLSRSVQDRDTAADLAQESYARVLAAQQTGQAVHDPRALLYRTARNLVIDQHRRSSIRAELETAAPAAGDEPALEHLPGPRTLEPETILASREGLAALVATIDQLPPRCREAFMLYKFDGLSYAQIAEHMGISTRTVEMQLQIAMEACWRCQDRLDGAAHARHGRARTRRAKP